MAPTKTVADAFASMEEFWTALRQHEAGVRLGSIWDTYESGERRQAEAALARAYDAPAAVVVCSGMAAITVSLIGASLFTGRPVERSTSCGYFEIVDVMEGIFGPL